MTKEQFTPPPNFAPGNTALGKLAYTIKRLMDLPVASLWPFVTAWLKGRSGSVLEVGGGAQPYRHLLPGDCTYQGLDWNQASEHFGYKAPDTTYYAGDTFPFEDATFDNLFCNEVLEHVYPFGQFLRECSRVLKSDSEFFISVPFQARYHYIPFDYWRFTPAALERILAEAGFVDVVVRSRGSDVTVAAYKCISVVYRLLRGNWPGKIAGILLTPLGGLALLAGHVSLLWNAGSSDDCLGYVATGKKR